jgi:hypothetical protein
MLPQLENKSASITQVETVELFISTPPPFLGMART